MSTSNILDELKWRNLLYDASEGVADLLSRERVTLYNGFDPTGDSLHVGHLVPLMALARFQRFGHSPIALAGGGTGMIGDPSGKSQERQLLTPAQVEANVEAIKQQLAHFLDFEVKSNPARVMNNADWLAPMSMMTFLRDIGKHITVNYMLSKDSVKNRLASESGISFTEFSYMLLQSYDFVYLFQHHGCALQTGGSDQWGNITAGVELIRRMTGGKAYGLVYPLIVKADGSKFGKTEGGSVWLDPKRTSPYRFYQFWINTDDADVVRYLKFFTWLTEAEVAELAHQVATQPEKREAQQRLARELTRMTHGETALARAEAASRVLFGGEIAGLTASDVQEIFEDVPAATLSRQQLEGGGAPLLDVLITAKLATSKGDARRTVEGGGVYVNNRQVADPARMISLNDAIDGQFVVLRKGRKSYCLLKLV